MNLRVMHAFLFSYILLALGILCGGLQQRHPKMFRSGPIGSVETDLVGHYSDPNETFWKKNREWIGKEHYYTMHPKYDTDQFLCVGEDLSSALKTIELKSANYRTIVVLSRGEKGDSSEETCDVFSVLDRFLDRGIQVERVVFHDIKSIAGLSPESEGRRLEAESYILPEIVFYGESISIYGLVAEYYQKRTGQSIKATLDHQNIEDISSVVEKLDESLLSGIKEIKTGTLSRHARYGGISTLKNLASFWVTDFHWMEADSREEEHVEKISTRDLHIHIDALRHYRDPSFSILSIFDITGVVTIAIDSEKKATIQDIEESQVKKLISDLASNEEKTQVDFGTTYDYPLTSTAMSSIFSLVCECKLYKYNVSQIYIKNSSFPSMRTGAIPQLPIYYSAKDERKTEKLEKCKIVVSPGSWASDIELKSSPVLELSEQAYIDFILKKSSIVMKKTLVSKIVKNPKLLQRLPKPLPGCLEMLCRNITQGEAIECMFSEKDRGCAEKYAYAMVYPCGHIACGPCGYRSMSEGFKALPTCIKCQHTIDTTAVYMMDNDVFNELEYSTLLEKNEYIALAGAYFEVYSALEPSDTGSGFLFMYGPRDSDIVHSIASILMPGLKKEYTWEQYLYGQALSYRMVPNSPEYPIYVVKINSRKQKIAIEIKPSRGAAATDDSIVFCIYKKRVCRDRAKAQNEHPNRYTIKMVYKELLKDENRSSFMFLYKRNYSFANNERNTREIEKFEKNLRENMGQINLLCTHFWNASGWS